MSKFVFGKYQINLRSFFSSTLGSKSNYKSFPLLGNCFSTVYGFGRTRTRWVLATAGLTSSCRIPDLIFSNLGFYRRQIISNSVLGQVYSFVGVELKHCVSKWSKLSRLYGSYKRKMVSKSSNARGRVVKKKKSTVKLRNEAE